MKELLKIHQASQDDAAKAAGFFRKSMVKLTSMLFEVSEAVPSEPWQRQSVAEGLRNRSGAMFPCESDPDEFEGVAFGIRGFRRANVICCG